MDSKKILICPLNWGIGHATRVIPLIFKYSEEGYKVDIGISKSLVPFFDKELPFIDKKIIYFPTIKYNRLFNLLIKILIQIPKLLFGIFYEHFRLKAIQKKERYSIIFSDNRYGLWAKGVHSIFMTHQLFIDTGCGQFVNNIVRIINYWFINKYDECWVPDHEKGITLSGKLGHPDTFPRTLIKYIGPVSRFFNNINDLESDIYKVDILVIISGPEPQRTIFERKIIRELLGMNKSVVIFGGKPEFLDQLFKKNKNIKNFSYGNSYELALYIKYSKFIICRSGYSTLMDLYIFNKKDVLLVPTPGQKEQEYLANYFTENFGYKCIKQSNNISI